MLSPYQHMQIISQITKYKLSKSQILWWLSLLPMLQIALRNHSTHDDLPNRSHLSTQIYTTCRFKTKIKWMGTPDGITSTIVHGIKHWETSLYNPSHSQWAPTYGSVLLTDIHITQAYSEQTRHVSWDSFIRGRISAAWVKAYFHHKQVKQKHITSSTACTSILIQLVL